MDARTKEAVRYLGYGNHAVDDSTLGLVASSFEELERTAGKRIIYRIFDVSFKDSDHLEIGKLDIVSKNLGKNLKGCQNAVVLGATLGAGVDMLLRKYALTDMARVVTLQACAAALLEEYLDVCQEEIRKEIAEQNLYLRPRFSPGYGDFSIEHQEMILRMLDTAKTIGLTMTDSSMLTPTKSVTAIIGLSKNNVSCHKKGCETCSKTDCIYRRNHNTKMQQTNHKGVDR